MVRVGATKALLSLIGGTAVLGACTTGVLLVKGQGLAAVAGVHADAPNAVVASSAVTAWSTGMSSATRAGLFRDGRYQVTGRYLTPGGDESIGVTLDVSANRIIGARVQPEAHSPTALQFQQQFGRRIVGQVVGRDLATVSVARVSGASLTTSGFDDALNRIRSQATR